MSVVYQHGDIEGTVGSMRLEPSGSVWDEEMGMVGYWHLDGTG